MPTANQKAMQSRKAMKPQRIPGPVPVRPVTAQQIANVKKFSKGK